MDILYKIYTNYEQRSREGSDYSVACRFSPGVDVHAEDGMADETELDEVAEDEAAGAEVDEALKEGRARQHGLSMSKECGSSMRYGAVRCKFSSANALVGTIKQSHGKNSRIRGNAFVLCDYQTFDGTRRRHSTPWWVLSVAIGWKKKQEMAPQSPNNNTRLSAHQPVKANHLDLEYAPTPPVKRDLGVP